MSPQEFQVQSEIQVSGVKVQMRIYPSTTCAAVEHCGEHNVIGLVQDHPSGAMVRQYGKSRCGLEHMGVIGFQPRQVPWGFLSPDGPWTSLVCEYEDDEAFEGVVGARKAWNLRTFEANCDSQSSTILQLLRLLERELRTPQFASSVVTESLTTAALHYLSRYVGTEKVLKSAGCYTLTQSQMKKIDGRLEDLSGSAPTVAEMAHLCGISERHLLRKFKNTTGYTIGHYVARAQVAQAKYLLSQTSIPIKVIAHKLGFKSHSSFSFAFYNWVLTSPTKFRRDAQGTRL